MVRIFQGRIVTVDSRIIFFYVLLGTDGCIDQTFTGIFWKSFGDLIGRELKPRIDQRLPSKFQIRWVDNLENDLSRYFLSTHEKNLLILLNLVYSH